MADSKTLVHTLKGVAIYLVGQGSKGARFFACVNGQNLYGPSMDSVCRKVEDAVKFQPFDALYIGREGLAQARIIGTTRDSHSELVWVTDDNDTRIGRYNTLYPVSARPALEALLQHRRETDQRKEQDSARDLELRRGLQELPKPDTITAEGSQD